MPGYALKQIILKNLYKALIFPKYLQEDHAIYNTNAIR